MLDTSGAIYDSNVKALRFYNYQVISGSPKIANHWWMCDSLCRENGKYRLKITTTDNNDDYDLILYFEEAEIDR